MALRLAIAQKRTLQKKINYSEERLAKRRKRERGKERERERMRKIKK
jgi:hypothetical protein